MLPYSNGFCIEPGCGEKFWRKSHNQKYCERHAQALSILQSSCKVVTCAFCKKDFSRQNSQQRYCDESCKRKAKMRRKRKKEGKLLNPKALTCAGCGVSFFPRVFTQRNCDLCVVKREDEKVPAPASLDELVCLRCKHSAPMKEATFGVECTIGMWLKCRPLSRNARPLEVRDEALDTTA